MSCRVQHKVNREFINQYNCYKRSKAKKALQKKHMAKMRLFIISLLVFIFILPKVFWNTYNSVVLKRVENAYIELPKSSAFLKLSETFLTNDYFLDSKFLGSINTNAPLMKSPDLTTEMPKLTARLKNLAAQNPSIEPGIFIWDFSTGRYVNISADKEFPTASMIKIPILCQLFRKYEAGQIKLDDKMTLTDYYVTGGSGYLQYKPLGTVLSVYNLAQLMIQESDNTATNMLLSSVGGVNEFNRALRSWGFNQTHMSNWLPDLDGTNVATPKDFGTMLYNIDNPEFLTIQSRAEIVKIMSHVKNRFLIQAGLPDNAQFIHKTGDIGTMLGDAGIVILPDGRKYIIAVMVKRPWNSYAAKQFIIDASKTTFYSYAANDL